MGKLAKRTDKNCQPLLKTPIHENNPRSMNDKLIESKLPGGNELDDHDCDHVFGDLQFRVITITLI